MLSTRTINWVSPDGITVEERIVKNERGDFARFACIVMPPVHSMIEKLGAPVRKFQRLYQQGVYNRDFDAFMEGLGFCEPFSQHVTTTWADYYPPFQNPASVEWTGGPLDIISPSMFVKALEGRYPDLFLISRMHDRKGDRHAQAFSLRLYNRRRRVMDRARDARLKIYTDDLEAGMF